jgi:hypothetical protein
MRKNYNTKIQDWVDKFIDDFRREVKALRPRLPGIALLSFGDIGPYVITEVFANGWAVGPNGGTQASPSLLAENFHTSKKKVSRILRDWARAGLLMGINTYDPRRCRQLPMEIILNPEFEKAARTVATDAAKTRRQLASVFADVWCRRWDLDGDFQGFGDEDIAWGRLPGNVTSVYREPTAEAVKPAVSGSLVEEIKKAKAGERLDAKQRRARELLERRERAEAFVEGAARVWTTMRARNGFGTEAPDWHGPPGKLSAAGRQSRRDLIAVFEKYGGLRASVTWALFCGAHQARDAKGRLVYDPNAAFQQNAGPDKKPKVFAANVVQALDRARQLEWFKDEALIGRLRGYFGMSLDAEPVLQATMDVHKSSPAAATTIGVKHGDPAATTSAPG